MLGPSGDGSPNPPPEGDIWEGSSESLSTTSCIVEEPSQAKPCTRRWSRIIGEVAQARAAGIPGVLMVDDCLIIRIPDDCVASTL
jgi:hypothetical protein